MGRFLVLLWMISGLFLIAASKPSTVHATRGTKVFLPSLINGTENPPATTPANTGTCVVQFAYQGSANPAYEEQVLTLINQERAKVGAAPVVSMDSLQQAARFHSNDMAKSGKFDHNGSAGEDFSTRLGWGCVKWAWAGEIISMGTNDPASAVRAWLDSPPHKGIMLDMKYDTAGVGVADANSQKYWTVDFIQVGK